MENKMNCPNCKRLREALGVADAAMGERRNYADAWEWKYGEVWDEEDATVAAALAPTPEELGEQPLPFEGTPV